MSDLGKRVDKLYKAMMKNKTITCFYILSRSEPIPALQKNVIQVLLIL